MGAYVAYDPITKAVYMFGGANRFNAPAYTSLLNQTWAFQNGKWSRLSPSHSPPEAAMGSAAWDPLLREMVIYGGLANFSAQTSLGYTYGYLQETWTFNGTDWTNITATAGLGPGMWSDAWLTMAYDPASKYIVLFGTFGNATTWILQNGSWSVLPTSGPHPSAREGDAMFYDPASKCMVLFGGWNGVSALSDTWSLCAGKWKDISSSSVLSPPARLGASFAWDTALSEGVLFGGATSCCDVFSDTWVYRGGNWTNVTVPHGPGSRYGGTAVYDPAIRSVLMIGGQTDVSPWILGNEWKFTSSGWIRVS